MSTTIRISQEDKSKLDNLIRYLSFHAHRKITQEEFIARLLAMGEQQKDALVGNLSDAETSKSDLSDDPVFHLPKLKLGRDASEDLDQTLYGGAK